MFNLTSNYQIIFFMKLQKLEHLEFGTTILTKPNLIFLALQILTKK